MYTENYNHLSVCHVTKEYSSRTCGPYWYVVQSHASPHTAFRTRKALDLWLDERGLTIEKPIESEGEWSPIIGCYRSTNHMDEQEFYTINGKRAVVMSNGDFTLAIIAADHDGIINVHHLNPNVRSRPVFNYRKYDAMDR